MAKKKAVQQDTPVCEASVKVLGKLYKATGATPQEAISKLSPGIVRGAVILTVSGKDRILTALQALRLFNARGITREVALKNVSLLFS